MNSHPRFVAIAVSMGLALPLAGLGLQGAEAAPPQSGPYVKATRALGGPTGTVLGLATYRDDSILVASSVTGGTGVLNIMDSPGDNLTPVDDSVTFPEPVLGVGVNQVDDTIYAVTGSVGTPLVVAALRGTTIDDTVGLPVGSGGYWADVAINNADDTVYVASQDDTRLYSFNGANLDDSRGVPLLASLTPRAVAVDQDDDTVYVLSSNITSGTSRITAMRGSNLDDSISVDFGMTTYLQSLAVNQIDGHIFVGGYDDTASLAQVRVFSPGLITTSARTINNVNPVMGLDVSPDGRRLYATTSDGNLYLLNTANLDDSASVDLDPLDPGGVAIDDFGWAWTARPGSMGGGSRSLIQIGTAPTFTSITPTGGLDAGGYTATITGSWFTPTTTAAFDDEANVAATVGTPSSNSMTVTVPPGAAGTVDLILTNVAGPSQPLGINDSGSFTYASPAPTYPPSPPLNVTASASDASATVTWTAPTSPGSFPVTNYAVASSPGGKTCLTAALTCTVTGLVNGTAYTFTVKALSGAGWSPESSPSNAVTPQASTKPSIVITGTRTGSEIRVNGTTSELTGTVTPWVRFPGQTDYTQGSARPPVNDNAFTWSRKANKKTYVYFTHDTAKSNIVVIAAR